MVKRNGSSAEVDETLYEPTCARLADCAIFGNGFGLTSSTLTLLLEQPTIAIDRTVKAHEILYFISIKTHPFVLQRQDD